MDDFKPNRSVDLVGRRLGEQTKQPDGSEEVAYNDQQAVSNDGLTDMGQVEGHAEAAPAQSYESNDLHITGNGKDPVK